MRSLSLGEFLAESGASAELVARLVEVGAIQPLPDGRYDAREQVVASMGMALLGAGIELADLAWALDNRRFGLRSLGHFFSEPVARTEATYAELGRSLGDDAGLLHAVYGAFGLPEPEPDDHPRVDEAELVRTFIRIWSTIDPTGAAHVRVARLFGDGARRIAEGTLDVWDEVALPDATTQGAPTVGSRARPTDPDDPHQNVAVEMGAVARGLVSLIHERQVEATLTARIVAAMENLLGAEGRLPDRVVRPPAIAFVDISGFTSLTVEHGDEAAAIAAAQLFDRADGAARLVGGRVVKQLGDGVLLRMPDSEAAVRTVAELVASTGNGDLPPAHAGIAAGPVIVRDGDVFGRTVNLASRIADRAAAGEVLVEEGVVVALPRGTARFEPVGRVPLKGFPDPIALWRATRPTGDGSAGADQSRRAAVRLKGSRTPR